MPIAITTVHIAAEAVVTITGTPVLLPAITTAATAAQISTTETTIVAANAIMVRATIVTRIATTTAYHATHLATTTATTIVATHIVAVLQFLVQQQDLV